MAEPVTVRTCAFSARRVGQARRAVTHHHLDPRKAQSVGCAPSALILLRQKAEAAVIAPSPPAGEGMSEFPGIVLREGASSSKALLAKRPPHPLECADMLEQPSPARG